MGIGRPAAGGFAVEPDIVQQSVFGMIFLLHALVATDLPGPGTVFLNQNWQFTAPVYIGDTITAEVNVLDVHDTKPVTHLSVHIWQQDGQTVLEGEAWCYTFSPA